MTLVRQSSKAWCQWPMFFTESHVPNVSEPLGQHYYWGSSVQVFEPEGDIANSDNPSWVALGCRANVCILLFPSTGH